jgi:glycosyltransferase involved in cell wall biosynthesis
MLEFGEALAGFMKSVKADVHSISAQPILGKGKVTRTGLSRFAGHADKFIFFPRALKKAAKEVDLVHFCGQYQAVYLSAIAGKPNILTCHDLLAIKLAKGQVQNAAMQKSGQTLQSMIQTRLPDAGHIVCVSTATLNDLGEYIKLKPGQTSVILNGLYEPISRMEDSAADAELRALGLDPATKYLFHIGGNQFYKNRPGVVRIFDELKKLDGNADLKLVMAGRAPDPSLWNVIEKSAFRNDILVKVDVSFEAKVALYTRAYALLFPSTAEGFGLPIVEAQSCGCPVITTDLPPMNEVALDSAVLIDPSDEPGAAVRISAALPSIRDLIPVGYENAKRFTLERMGNDYLRAYENALATQGKQSA